jgi:hypothetical protein
VCELHEAHGGGRHALGGLHDVRVARDETDREHPEGDHSGEIEGRNTGAHAEGHFVRVCVHALGHVLQRFAHEVVGCTARRLHHLQPSAAPSTPHKHGWRCWHPPEHIAARVSKGLALLLRDDGRQLLLVLADKGLVPDTEYVT